MSDSEDGDLGALAFAAGMPGRDSAAASEVKSSSMGQAVTETTAARGKFPAT
jgi:hypothetical protein